MEYRAKGGIFHAIVRFCIAISCLSRYVCNTFSQVECERLLILCEFTNENIFV